MITIIDYGAGNIGSIKNMLRRAGADATLSDSPERVAESAKLILPGVGHFDYGMQELKRRGLIEALREGVQRGAQLLGICLGAQLLARGSEEGSAEGLSLLAADVKRFETARLPTHLKIPHMGWADIEVTSSEGILANLPPSPRFYFVHSYHLVCDAETDVLARARHGYDFVAAAGHGKVLGVQFHPEKSHAYGLRLLQNFAQAA